MKKSIFSILVPITSMLFSSCDFTGTSTPSNSLWDVSYYDGSLRILAEYRSHWTFGSAENGSFDLEQLLVPSRYQEDEEAVPYYETEGYDQVVDRSAEEIAFATTPDSRLADFSDSLSLGILSAQQRMTLMSLLDTNDDVITESWRNFTDKVLYYDYFYGDYGEDFNYIKTSSFDVKRYDNFVKVGVSNSNILYGDSTLIDFVETDQTFSDAYRVYQIHDEAFPKAFRYNAKDSRVTTLRDAGTLKAALNVSGGLYGKVWLSRHIAEFDDYMNPSSPNYNAAYSYRFYASKTASGLALFFEGKRDRYEDPVDGIYYDMALDFKVTINGGIVSSIDSYQRFTTSIFE